MKKLILLALLFQASAAFAAGDDALIKANVADLERGWNTKDHELFAKPFAEDVDYVAINGLDFRGRKTVAEAHRQIFATLYKESTITLKVKNIRMITPAVAIVHAGGHNRFKQGDEFRELDMVLVMVMTKSSEGWRIVAFQNTRVEPGAQLPRGK